MELKMAIFTHLIMGAVYLVLHIGLNRENFDELMGQVMEVAKPLGPLVGSFIIAAAFFFCALIWPYLLCKKIIKLFKGEK
jgi:hypothetical protein